MTGKRSKYHFLQKGETGQHKNWNTHEAILYIRTVVLVVVVAAAVAFAVAFVAGAAAAVFNTRALSRSI